MSRRRPVLILGAGINGAALAREFLLNAVPVCVVDESDLSSGATARSSRLIHGGLRYLEYGEFDLVRESLSERTRLLRLAPHLVRPLRIFIPVTNRWGGAVGAVRKFFGWEGSRRSVNHPSRGLWLVRAGLRFYDEYARDPTLPRHGVHRVGEAGVPSVDRRRYLAMCSYSDAQLLFPERFVVELFEDARRIATERGVEFELRTYCRAERRGEIVEVRRMSDQTAAGRGDPLTVLRPAAIINATGAWVDRTLGQLDVASRRLMGGTKGSHLVIHHEGLCAALNGQALYAEAGDGRPVFVLPFGGDSTLVGTTDIPYAGDPRDAVASSEEIDYLIDAANSVVEGVSLSRDDVTLHYSGIRPLPHAEGKTAAAITRRHWLEVHQGTGIPFYSVIGGKLTTCRSLAEESVAAVLKDFGETVRADSRERPLPGGRGFPQSLRCEREAVRELADRYSLSPESVTHVWQWMGSRTHEVLSACSREQGGCVAGTRIPRGVVRWIIEHEWVQCLEDLVERRLMLVFEKNVSRETLVDLAQLMDRSGKLAADEIDTAVEEVVARMRRVFGRSL